MTNSFHVVNIGRSVHNKLSPRFIWNWFHAYVCSKFNYSCILSLTCCELVEVKWLQADICQSLSFAFCKACSSLPSTHLE